MVKELYHNLLKGKFSMNWDDRDDNNVIIGEEAKNN